MTDIIQKLKEANEKRTQGEWYHNFFKSPRGAVQTWQIGLRGYGSRQIGIANEEDSEFIALATNSMSTLLKIIEIQQEALEKISMEKFEANPWTVVATESALIAKRTIDQVAKLAQGG